MFKHQIYLVGRATQDCETLETKADKTQFYKFSLAINEYRGKDKKEAVTFYDVLSFRKQPQSIAKKVKRGDIVFVVGDPKASAYEDKTGELVASVSVNSSYISLFTGPDFTSKSNKGDKKST